MGIYYRRSELNLDRMTYILLGWLVLLEDIVQMGLYFLFAIVMGSAVLSCKAIKDKDRL